MNIFPKFLTRKDEDPGVLDADELAKMKRELRPKRGPGTGKRYATPRQLERIQIRNEKRAQRKANERHRRQWMREQQAKANARGQMEVLARPAGDPYRDGLYREMVRQHGRETADKMVVQAVMVVRSLSKSA